MMRNDHWDENSLKVFEPAHRSERERTNHGINFLKVEDSKTTDSLNHIIEEVRSQEAPRSHCRRRDVQVDLDPAVSSVGLDVATVGRALGNLVTEAIDQSPEGGDSAADSQSRFPHSN
jgi:signal transduction histidine kinase